MIAAGVALVIIDMIRNFRFSTGEGAGNVHGGGTLEWLPNDLYSARSIPVIKSCYPLWDDPDIGKSVEEGRYFLPNSATGERETIVTSPFHAEPQYLQRMPGPSWFHLWAAATTAAFFLLLTVKLYWIALAFGVAAILCILRWVWDLDLPIIQPQADIGAGILVPTYASGPRSHGWWAMIVLMTVLGMIFLMLCFSYIFLWSRNPLVWPEAPDVGAFILAGLAGAIALACAIGQRAVYARSPNRSVALALTGAAALGVGWFISFDNWTARPFAPQLHSHDALIATFLSWDALFVGVVALMALYALARRRAGLLAPERPATIECIALFTGYSAAQMLIGLTLTRLFPMAA
jgi:cytochrome c oxidase subunit I+III